MRRRSGVACLRLVAELVAEVAEVVVEELVVVAVEAEIVFAFGSAELLLLLELAVAAVAVERLRSELVGGFAFVAGSFGLVDLGFGFHLDFGSLELALPSAEPPSAAVDAERYQSLEKENGSGSRMLGREVTIKELT